MLCDTHDATRCEASDEGCLPPHPRIDAANYVTSRDVRDLARTTRQDLPARCDPCGGSNSADADVRGPERGAGSALTVYSWLGRE